MDCLRQRREVQPGSRRLSMVRRVDIRVVLATEDRVHERGGEGGHGGHGQEMSRGHGER